MKNRKKSQVHLCPNDGRPASNWFGTWLCFSCHVVDQRTRDQRDAYAAFRLLDLDVNRALCMQAAAKNKPDEILMTTSKSSAK